MDRDLAAQLELAESFLALRASPAFISILSALQREVLAAEGKAILGDSSIPTRTIRRDIIAWQERKKIILGIESILDEQQQIKDSIIEGEADERRIAADRAGRAGW